MQRIEIRSMYGCKSASEECNQFDSYSTVESLPTTIFDRGVNSTARSDLHQIYLTQRKISIAKLFLFPEVLGERKQAVVIMDSITKKGTPGLFYSTCPLIIKLPIISI